MAAELARPGRRPVVSATWVDDRRSTRLAAVSALALAASLSAWAVPPPLLTLEEQLDKAEYLIREGDHSAALSLLDEIAAGHAREIEGGTKVGEDFWFRHARAARLAEHDGQAANSAMRYLADSGGAGAHYRAAVQMIADLAPAADAHRSRGSGQYSELRARLEVERDRSSRGFADPLKSGGHGPEMVVVPAGRFYMGCPAEDHRCGRTGKPIRSVSIAAFAMARHETTFAEWDACVAAKACRG